MKTDYIIKLKNPWNEEGETFFQVRISWEETSQGDGRKVVETQIEKIFLACDPREENIEYFLSPETISDLKKETRKSEAI
jgi:hypothetical protein